MSVVFMCSIKHRKRACKEFCDAITLSCYVFIFVVNYHFAIARSFHVVVPKHVVIPV